MRKPKITVEEFLELALDGVPYVGLLDCRVTHLARGEIDILLPWRELLVRPGGTVCGPAMMALADIALYGVVLSLAGPVALAVTTDLDIRFLRKPKPGDLLGRGRLLKAGKTLVVGEVSISPTADPRPVAHAIGTYILPTGG